MALVVRVVTVQDSLQWRVLGGTLLLPIVSDVVTGAHGGLRIGNCCCYDSLFARETPSLYTGIGHKDISGLLRKFLN